MNLQVTLKLTNGESVTGTVFPSTSEGLAEFKATLSNYMSDDPNSFSLDTDDGWIIAPFTSILCVHVKEMTA